MNDVRIAAMDQISALGLGLDPLMGLTPLDAAKQDAWYPHIKLTEVTGEIAPTSVKASDLRQMDNLTQVTVACAERVVNASAVATDEIDPQRLAVIIGSAFGCTSANHDFLETFLQKGARFVKPVVFRNTVSNAVAGHLAVTLGFKGANSVINSGMVSGLQALAYAFEEIRHGHCDAALSGASDWSSDVMVKRYAEAARHESAGQFPLMDGACLMLLAKPERASASPWSMAGYSLGYGNAADSSARLERMLNRALDNAGLEFDALDAVVLHGNATACWFKAQAENIGIGDVCRRMAADGVLTGSENTAVPSMLALAETLRALPTQRSPKLFATADADSVMALSTTPKHVAFVSSGADGGMVVLMFTYHGA